LNSFSFKGFRCEYIALGIGGDAVCPVELTGLAAAITEAGDDF
jgi:hypothetical protein